MDYKADPKSTEEIKLYFHCRKCVMERPPDQSMREWARIGIGYLDKGQGIQVWCNRHEEEIGKFEPNRELPKEEVHDECTHYFFKELLFDFLRELPSDFHRDCTTVKRAYQIIFEFMRNHELCGKGCEDKDADTDPRASASNELLRFQREDH